MAGGSATLEVVKPRLSCIDAQPGSEAEWCVAMLKRKDGKREALEEFGRVWKSSSCHLLLPFGPRSFMPALHLNSSIKLHSYPCTAGI